MGEQMFIDHYVALHLSVWGPKFTEAQMPCAPTLSQVQSKHLGAKFEGRGV